MIDGDLTEFVAELEPETFQTLPPPGLEASVTSCYINSCGQLGSALLFAVCEEVKKQKKKQTHPDRLEGELPFSLEPGDGSYIPVRNVCVKVSKNNRDLDFLNKASGEKKKNLRAEDGNTEMHLEIIRGACRKKPAVNINLSPLVGSTDEQRI